MHLAQTTERARLGLNHQLDLAKTQSERNQLGQFATPPQLAADIVDLARTFLPDDGEIRFLDPAFGTGVFYSTLLQRFPETQIVAATGYEIDPHYGQVAGQLWHDTPLKLEIADFTQTLPPTKTRANLILCNPPYVRHHHLSRERKQHLQHVTAQNAGIQLSGLAGLHCHFLCLGDAWMEEGGIAVWLMPSGFLDVNYGQSIRDYLLTRTTLLRVHRFHPADVQFEDALVSSCVLCFQKAPPPTDHRVCFSKGGRLTSPQRSRQISPEELCQTSKWMQLELEPHRTQSCEGKTQQKTKTHTRDLIAESLVSNAPRQKSDRFLKLGDLFTIKRGLATGANQFFILTPEQIARYQLPAAFLHPILPSSRYLRVDEIAADARGNPQIARQLYLLACTRPEAELLEEYPHLWDYLQRGKAQGIHQRYICRHRSPWYAQEKRPPAPILCTYMGRKSRERSSPFRFILNHSQATAPNVYLMLYPKPNLALSIRERPETLKIIWQALARISSGELIGKGRVYGGGLHKLEPKELGNACIRVALGDSLFREDAVLGRGKIEQLQLDLSEKPQDSGFRAI